MTLKQRLLRPVNFRQYATVGLRDPQQQVQVWLRGAGEPLDVTTNNVVAALSPLTIGVMLPRDGLHGKSLRLSMEERGSNRLLGAINLRLVRTIPLPEHQFCLFETSGCENYCLGALNLRLYYLYEWWRCERHQRKNPYNFRMTHADIRSIFAFYICPRPVVLVSVEHEGSSNLFPMDLIGPTDSPWFSMALRHTSPAVRLMQQAGHMALASIPLSFKDIAYEMGKHHQQTSIDWAGLPFETAPSPCFGLRVPAAALRVREVRVVECHEVGSHMLFLTSIVQETANADSGLQMFHIAGTYNEYLQR